MSKQDNEVTQLLQDRSKQSGYSIESKQFAEYLDQHDELSKYREHFHYPKNKTIPVVDANVINGEEDCVYLCGNSLGLCPKTASGLLDQEMKKWQECGVMGHHTGQIPWEVIGEDIMYQAAELVGAKVDEVVMMNTLSGNLHFMMASFYQPTPTRHKILVEGGSFPSDYVAVRSQIDFHNYNPDDSLILVSPREGEHTLRTEDIVHKIEQHGHEIALVMFTGVHFYTGQFFDMEAIAAVSQRVGCRVGFDLAHAVGNVEMKLHDWNVDFACWCTYKYMNGGPGAVAGAFVHEKHFDDSTLKRLDGWWGVTFQKRFTMANEDLSFIKGAMAYAVSNPPVMSLLPVMASLKIFHDIGMSQLVKKQKLLTGLLEYLLLHHLDDCIDILTPSTTRDRGCQLSISFAMNLDNIFKEIQRRGVVCDMRRSHVLRVAPAPLYNSFKDVYNFVTILRQVLDEMKAN